jgi:hypothetical protein
MLVFYTILLDTIFDEKLTTRRQLLYILFLMASRGQQHVLNERLNYQICVCISILCVPYVFSEDGVMSHRNMSGVLKKFLTLQFYIV